MSNIQVRSAYSLDHVEHPAAYENAIRARIKQNASKTRRKNWFAAHSDAQRLWDWLYGLNEFGSRFSCGLSSDEYQSHNCSDIVRCCDKGVFEHPTRVGMFEGNFGKVLLEMREATMEWGGLTDKQTDLVRRALARAGERVAKAAQRRDERLEADRAGSTHVGAVGERCEFTLTCEKVFEFEGQFGLTFINICRDVHGNVVVYKGSNGFDEAVVYVLKATIKKHDERNGVKQTLISRPKILREIDQAEAA